MAKTVLITGCSSGIGKAAAGLFAEKGWNVIATMRNPADAGDLATNPSVLVAQMDVTDNGSVVAAVEAGLSRFGAIDVVVNNAGFGAFGPFETASAELIDRQLSTNVVGVMNVVRAVLPGMRAQKSGVIVNVASIGGLTTMPLNSIYHATKYAVVGFTEGLTYELQPFGIDAKVVAPGGVATDFAGRSLSTTFKDNDHAYADTVGKVMAAFRARSGSVYSSPEAIAEAIFAAATDGTKQVIYIAGDDAKALKAARDSMNDADYVAFMNKRFGLAE